MTRRLRVRCRQIQDYDIDEIIGLLLKSGFPGDRDFWLRGFERLAARSTPAGFPKYGLLLEVNGVSVGVLVMITTLVNTAGQAYVRCNFSSWFVWPAFRSYAPFMVANALRNKEAVYYNTSPLPFTLPILEAQSFTRYVNGRLVSLPALHLGPRGARFTRVTLHTDLTGFGLDTAEAQLLLDHVAYGCLVVIGTLRQRRYSFVFDLRWRFRAIRLAYLVYCRSIDDFIYLAGPLGRFLARHGYPVVIVDANAPEPRLASIYRPSTPKYFKGAIQPRIGDLAYSEQVIFGLIA